MAGVQTAVNQFMPLGIPGDVVTDHPSSVMTRTLDSNSVAQTFGYAFTESATDGYAQVGGTGAFAGILIQPRTHASSGAIDGSDALGVRFSLADEKVGQLLRMGAVNVQFGEQLGTLTASQSTTTLTVTAVSTGLKLGIGTVIKNAAGSSTIGVITALGTGTGGTGTYTLSTSATVASVGMTAYATSATTAKKGDAVLYDTANGAISFTERTASFTASQSTTTLTVAAITAGSIGVGTVVLDSTGASIGTVIALGTGVGGVGTYTMSTSATVGSATFTAASVAPVGKKFIPNAEVAYRDMTAAGVAIVRIVGV
jgi:hypothetical protein